MAKTGKIAGDKRDALDALNTTTDATQGANIATLTERELPTAAFLVDGALTKTTGIKALTKATAGAYTLAAPTAAEAGAEITIVAATAAAHVVTATALIDDGVTGGSKTTMTFAAFIGASIRLTAYNLKWVVIAKNVVTIT